MADPRAEIVTSPAIATVLMEETVNYWTPERMTEAEPIAIEFPPEAVQLLSEAETQATVQAGNPETKNSIPSGASGANLAVEPQPPVPGGTSRTEQVPNRGVFPYQAVGKLFMSFGNRNYVGSAWTIAESGIFTAGHCVFEREMGWATRLLFVPRFHDGSAPIGQWTFTQIASVSGWTRDRNFQYDLACFKTDRPIRPQTGSLGFMANHPSNSGPYTGIGYPASATSQHPFNGQRMWRSSGNYISGSNPIQSWNNMTGGCSGGPWATWRNGQVYANGLNSFRYTNNPATMYSPYFGEAFLNLYNWVK
jgi:V8-like Glu-specific endopeptidase